MNTINQGSFRNVSVSFSTAASSVVTTPAAPIDFYKSAMEWVGNNEYRWNKRRQDADVPNVTNLTILINDKTPYVVYRCTVTTVMATGSYSFTFVKAAGTVEEAMAN